jgi:hypothetical protein
MKTRWHSYCLTHRRNFAGYFWNYAVHIYRVVQNSVNINHSIVLTGIIRFKPASQSVERYHRVVICALIMEDIIWKKKSVNSLRNKEIHSVILCHPVYDVNSFAPHKHVYTVTELSERGLPHWNISELTRSQGVWRHNGRLSAPIHCLTISITYLKIKEFIII